MFVAGNPEALRRMGVAPVYQQAAARARESRKEGKRKKM
jgi:hypothetical protein